MSSPYAVLDNRPINQLKVTELKEELKRRELPTKGLKEELVRRLDEALRQEDAATPPETENNGSDMLEQEEVIGKPVNSKNPEDYSDAGDMPVKKVDEEMGEIDAAAYNRVPLDEEEFSSGKPVDAAVSTKAENEQITDVEASVPAKEDQIAEVTVVRTSELVSVSVESATVFSGQDSQNGDTQNESRDLKDPLENHVSNSLQVEAKVSSSNQENQVSEVSPVLGFQVTSDSVSTYVSVDEKTEVKGYVVADDSKLDLDVKPETLQHSSSTVGYADDKSSPMVVEDLHVKKASVEEPCSEHDKNVHVVKPDGNGDSTEKLQLDRSPGDDSMEEVASEGKITATKLDSGKMTDGKDIEVNMSKEVGSASAIDTKSSAPNVEDDGSNMQPMKRKADVADQQTAVGSNDIVKRQRRWNSEDLKVPEKKQSDAPASTTPKDFFQPSFRRSFSRSDPLKEEAPKERVVPPSLRPPTNSLKIENFLRPFTLKAVQELLSKTGTVTDFWMDAIKTHCLVSFSSVEESTETRNAVYNLQWPPNGGKLLVAEFIDPQEVKDKVEAPPQSPMTPATPLSTTPVSAAPPFVYPQPSPRQQIQNKQLQPPLPPPPPLSNPPSGRKLQPAREQHALPLPPPPPLPEKVDPPIVTLDDLFRKTKATPRIYYLPLSDEQVAAKLKAQGKSIKQ